MNIPDQGPEPSSIGQIGVALAAFLGVSYGLVEAFDQLWVGLSIAVVSALALTVFTVIGQQILKKIAPSIADKIIDICSLRGSRYKGYYLQHAIEFEHRTFDVKGLSTQNIYTLELEQVFVDLSLAPKVPHKASNNPIEKLPEKLQTGRHSVWDYLQAGNGKPQHLAILGAPGSGKTTLMKHLALSLALRKKAKTSVTLPDWLPILLFLRDHAKAIESQEGYGLIEAIKADLAHFKDKQPPAGWFEGWLGSGRCLILLDGLDEVADHELRRKVVAWVEDQMAAYGQNRFVVTSRPFGYRDNPLEGVTVLDVRPFTASQVETFVHNWYRANEIMAKAGQDDPGVRREAEKGARDLISRLWGTPALSDLAVNPLLLTMIATVHRYRSSLPGRRVELYKEICEVFLGKRSQAKGLHLDLTPAQRQTVLQPLAYTMMQRNLREVAAPQAELIIEDVLAEVGAKESPAEFLKDTENNSGLLIEREGGVYAFAHFTFQEYLAAVHITERGLVDELKVHVAESWWHETIRLYAAQADASPIIEACLVEAPVPVQALVLVIECREEAKTITPMLRKRLNKVLDQGLDSVDSETSNLVGETLLTLRLKRLIRIDDQRHIDGSLISNAEYQLFLDDKRRHGDFCQPDHWLEIRYPKGKAHDPILGMRPEDAEAFCTWLTGREDGPWEYRLPRVEESMNQGIREDLPAGYWTSESDFIHGIVPSAKEGERKPLRLDTRDLARARTRAQALDLDLDLDRALDLAQVLALVLARDCDLELPRDLDLDRVPDFDLDLDLARNLPYAPSLNHASDLDLDSGFGRGHALAIVRTLDEIFMRDVGANLEQVDKIIGLLLNRKREKLKGSGKEMSDSLDFLCRLAMKYLGSFLIRALAFQVISKWSFRKMKRHIVGDLIFDADLLADSETTYRYTLQQVQELHRRIKGESEPFEGIRIVRERKKEDAAAKAA